MNNVLILCALRTELNFVLSHLSNVKKTDKFYYAKYNGINIITAKSGFGKIRSAAFTQYAIDNIDNLDLIVNFGCCGLVDDNLDIGDIVLCYKTIEYDFHTLRDFIPEVNIEYNIDESIIERFNLKKGILLTATQNVDSKDKKISLHKKFNGTVADWEGAAVAQIAKLNNKNVMILKCVTDRGDENLLNDFKEQFDTVMEKASSLLLELLDALNQQGYLCQ
jgi:adenosylhomocysteine nucleosidase